MPSDERSYDVVVFGATGFTGQLVCSYLARKAELDPTRWAIAGRSKAKLEEVRRALAAIDSRLATLAIVIASVDDPPSLQRMAARTRVVLTTVGPYQRHGEPVVAACVAAGSDYVDITGEPEFVDTTRARYDARARDKGVRIVSCCGFDSVPHDLGVYFTVQQLPRDVPITIEGFVRASGTFSGGTWQSALGAMARFSESRTARRSAKDASADGTATHGRRVHGVRPRLRWEKRLRAWACPLPTIDPEVVLRSARTLDAYGPDFRYGHYAQVRHATTLLGGAVVLGSALALAQLKPTRSLLERVRASGEGPSPETRARAKFRVTFFGSAGGVEVVTTVSGGDPGYDETAKMASESALTLAMDRDALPARAGTLTPAAAMGDALLARLQRAAIRFEVTTER